MQNRATTKLRLLKLAQRVNRSNRIIKAPNLHKLHVKADIKICCHSYSILNACTKAGSHTEIMIQIIKITQMAMVFVIGSLHTTLMRFVLFFWTWFVSERCVRVAGNQRASRSPSV